MGGSPLFHLLSYFNYRLKAQGPSAIHSPFVFGLLTKVIKPSRSFRLEGVEAVRKKIAKDHQVVDLMDFKTNLPYRTTLSSIVKHSSSTSRFSAFLHFLTNWLDVKTILETGTSLGINTQYLAHSNVKEVVTIEGSQILAQLANRYFNESISHKIESIKGDIQTVFLPTIERLQPELIFLDADHRGSVIEKQVELILNHNPMIQCIIIHDIYWSKDMFEAWDKITHDKHFSLTIDLFQAGLIFPKMDMEKQHFTLRF